ncbi:chemotaxis protein CheW [Halopseudomonas pachastrellae]|nr:chemotaxis protein CheW [Halopseudomonas pachastrellae]
MPQRHPNVVGVIHLRGQTIPVIDLSGAIGLQPQAVDANSTIIVTEYNLSVQAFLVRAVDRIMNLNWDAVQPPPRGAGARIT